MVELLGLGLLIVGLALIVAELTFPGYYIGVAGTVGLVVGLLEMVWPTFLTSPASGPIAALVAVVAAMISFQFYRKFSAPINQRGGSPGQELLGKTGIVVRTIRPHTIQGRVEIQGKLWGADGLDPIGPGSHIIVDQVRETHVVVKRAPTEQQQP